MLEKRSGGVDNHRDMTRSHPVVSTGLDALAAAATGGLLLYLPFVDGGFLPAPTRWAGWILVAALPVFFAEMRRVPIPGRILASAWGLGALVAFAAALERTAFWRPLIVYALLPLTAVATMRIWRRGWGPPALLMLLLLSFGRTWYEGFAAWHGTALSDTTSLSWRSLSFNHQSAAAMLMGGVAFAAIAVTASRPAVRLGTGLVAAAGLSGLWLSDSPWSLAAAGAGLAVVALGTRTRHCLLRLGAVVATAAALVAVLTFSQGGTSDDAPLADLQSIDISRLDHWEAGLAMFTDRPLTGRGPGSFATAGSRFADPGADVTVAALSEPLEALAEGGLVFGLPVLTAFAFVVFSGVARIRSAAEGSEFRDGILLAGAASAMALTLHAAVHFDWLFPLVAAYLAAGAGIVFGERERNEPSGPSTMLYAVPVVAVLAIGLAGATVESGQTGLPDDPTPLQLAEAAIPWNGPYARSLLTQLLLAGYPEEAGVLADRTLGWNPGYRGMTTLDALADYLDGSADAGTVRDTLDQEHPDFATFNLAAEILRTEGDLEEARAVAGNTIALLPFYAAAEPIEPASQAWMLWIDLTGRLQGCDAALAAVEVAADDPIVGPAGLDDAFRSAADPHCP